MVDGSELFSLCRCFLTLSRAASPRVMAWLFLSLYDMAHEVGRG